MTRVKICGLTNLADAECAALCGADALGFVFAESPRRVEADTARAILAGLGPFLTGVGVFVDLPAPEVRAVLLSSGCTVAQLHGDEGGEALQALAPLAVIEALRVRGRIEEAQLAPLRTARALLLDAYVPGRSGGTGRQFDHRLAADLVQRGWRVVLAGGLTPENVFEAVRTVRPYGVDVSSGVEAAPGRKDHRKLAEFIAAVRAADASQGYRK